MTETAPTEQLLNLSNEATSSATDLLVIGGIGLLAVAYLVRGFLRKRRNIQSEGGCSGCPSCGGAIGNCQVPSFLPDDTKPPNG